MIYFLRHVETGLVKIGYTNNLSYRLTVIANTYGTVELIGFMEGDQGEELSLHRRFREINVRGVLNGREWFSSSQPLLDYITANCDTGSQTTYTPGKRFVSSKHSKVEFVSTFAAALARKESRDGRRYTQIQISRETGISASVMTRIFAGHISGLSLSKARKLCLWLDCEVGDLLYIDRRDKEPA